MSVKLHDSLPLSKSYFAQSVQKKRKTLARIPSISTPTKRPFSEMMEDAQEGAGVVGQQLVADDEVEVARTTEQYTFVGPTKGGTSDVWKHFGFKRYPGKQTLLVAFLINISIYSPAIRQS